MTSPLRAPFPWFGGKSRAAHLAWAAFGDVANYVEPFAGSLAVLLARPTPPRIETVNDLDCYLANFWRAVAADSQAVAHHADWPVNEADLHARHQWLVNQADFRERMKSDPDFFDAKIAGWWVWGLSAWLGSGWCRIREAPPVRLRSSRQPDAASTPCALVSRAGNQSGGQVSRQIPFVGNAGRGVHRGGGQQSCRLARSRNSTHRRVSTRRPSEGALTTCALGFVACGSCVATGGAS